MSLWASRTPRMDEGPMAAKTRSRLERRVSEWEGRLGRWEGRRSGSFLGTLVAG